jgi:hypothetical protein
MKVLWALLAAVLLCGCVRETTVQPTTTVSAPPTVSAVPSTVSATSSTTLEPTTSTASATLSTAAPSSSTDDIDVAYVIPTTTEPTATTVGGSAPVTPTTLSPLIRTFTSNGGGVCSYEGKPIIRLYSKGACEHCKWGGPIFDKVAKEYVAAGKIIAYHWSFDEKDDLLTEGVEGMIPEGEAALFYAGNQTTVPYYLMGCKYWRVGNGYDLLDRKDREEAEQRAVIEQLIAEARQNGQ